MFRCLFAIGSAISLLLCFATGALWLSSNYAHVRYIWHDGRDAWGLVNCDGRLQLVVVRNQQGYGFEDGFHFLGGAVGWWEMRGGIRGANRLGVGWFVGGVPFQGSWGGPTPPPTYVWLYDAYYLDYWLPFVLTAFLPAVWLLQFVRKRGRRRVGYCRICGYDLRASVVRCPECGTPIPVVSTA